MRQLVGAIYTGRPGRDPFDPTLWSSISRNLFTRIAERGMLHRAIGVELSWPRKAYHVLWNFSWSRPRWKSQLLFSPAYRRALTGALDQSLRHEDRQHVFLQIGAMFDAPSLLDGRGGCFSYHDGNLAERINSPFPLPPLGARFIDRALEYERQVYHKMSRIFTFSQYLKNSFVTHFGVPPERIVPIGAGINLNRVPDPDPEKRYDRQELLFIGVDFQRKGGEYLLRAFARVREKLPGATLHIVGPRPIAPGTESRGVVYHGFLSRENPDQARRLDALFRTASLFVMPSLYEPFGIAPLEAMAHQIPCVVTNGWALTELVTPGVTGELVAPASADDLADKLLRLLNDPDGLRRMGWAGRDEVVNKYQWDRVVDRLIEEIGGVT